MHCLIRHSDNIFWIPCRNFRFLLGRLPGLDPDSNVSETKVLRRPASQTYLFKSDCGLSPIRTKLLVYTRTLQLSYFYRRWAKICILSYLENRHECLLMWNTGDEIIGAGIRVTEVSFLGAVSAYTSTPTYLWRSTDVWQKWNVVNWDSNK